MKTIYKMKIVVAMLLLCVAASVAQQPTTPPSDEAQVVEHQKALDVLKDRIENRKKQRHAREVAGIRLAPAEALDALAKNGIAVNLSYDFDESKDAEVLGGPPDGWMWIITGPSGQQVLSGKKVTVVVKEPGSYTVRLNVMADHGHRQQSHSAVFKVNVPYEWDATANAIINN